MCSPPLVEAQLFAFELCELAFELRRDLQALSVQTEVDTGDLLDEAIALAHLEGEVGKQRAELKLCGVDFGLYYKLQPQAEFGDMHCPIHHIHAVELVADDASAALVGRLFDTELLVGARLQVIQHQEHAYAVLVRKTGTVTGPGEAPEPMWPACFKP
jgi:hypothetical protein